MNGYAFPGGRLLPLCFLLGILCGCASQPTHYYTLHTIAGGPASVWAQGEASVGVGPVRFPDYLDRSQIMVRTSSNELQVSQFHKWAGPLKDTFTSTLAEDLSVLLASNRVLTFPWDYSVSPSYQVVVNVIRFDGKPGENAQLSAHWTILEGKKKEYVQARKSVLTRTVGGSDTVALVMAQSELVGELAREIAGALREMPAGVPEPR